MYLKEKNNGHLVEVIKLSQLIDLNSTHISCRSHYGEEVQEAENYMKAELIFLSGEKLPLCWTNSHYRDDELIRHH